MANALYPSAKTSFLQGEIDLVSDTIKVQLVDLADYTYSSSHEFLNELAAAARVGSAVTLTGKTVIDGVFDAADVSVPAVTGDSVEAYVLYKDTGNEATSRLIAYFDSAASGLPLTPSGEDVSIVFSNGSSKVFAI